ncbi:MAG: hypothetical protein ACP5QO_17120, partial [Clostridia bacterium]
MADEARYVRVGWTDPALEGMPAQVELPERVAKLVVLGSGAKAGLREWFALPELALLIGIGAQVEVMRGAWQAEDQEIIPT